jgi:hypothetical protein
MSPKITLEAVHSGKTLRQFVALKRNKLPEKDVEEYSRDGGFENSGAGAQVGIPARRKLPCKWAEKKIVPPINLY